MVIIIVLGVKTKINDLVLKTLFKCQNFSFSLKENLFILQIICQFWIQSSSDNKYKNINILSFTLKIRLSTRSQLIVKISSIERDSKRVFLFYFFQRNHRNRTQLKNKGFARNNLFVC